MQDTTYSHNSTAVLDTNNVFHFYSQDDEMKIYQDSLGKWQSQYMRLVVKGEDPDSTNIKITMKFYNPEDSTVYTATSQKPKIIYKEPDFHTDSFIWGLGLGVLAASLCVIGIMKVLKL